MNEDTKLKKIEWQNGVGLAAKQLCSLSYVSKLDPTLAQSLYIDPILNRLNQEITVHYDSSHQSVTVTSHGSYIATAQMRDGIGCTITTRLPKNSHLPEVNLPEILDIPLLKASPEEKENSFNQIHLTEALNTAFSPSHNSLAVVILHKGKLVAEKYAVGITSSTPLPGWSMAKSLTATFVGLLVKEGKLDINKPGVVPEWRDRMDGSEKVTLDHLLRMTSGLDVLEDQSGADPNSRMIFEEPDAAAFAAKRGIKQQPGTHWEYMSGNTILACRAIFEAVGGTLESSQRFYRESFMKPLGAASFVFETDAAGTFIGSSYAIANPHDWAKFGQLYLDKGVWENERILPDDWVNYVTSHTSQSGSNSYGAGFWTVETSDLDFLPKDTFYANGFQGQYVIVIPSHSLVIVRLGASLGPDGIWQLVKDVVAAKR